MISRVIIACGRVLMEAVLVAMWVATLVAVLVAMLVAPAKHMNRLNNRNVCVSRTKHFPP